MEGSIDFQEISVTYFLHTNFILKKASLFRRFFSNHSEFISHLLVTSFEQKHLFYYSVVQHISHQQDY